MTVRRGLPGELETEAKAAIRQVFLKYLNMKKRHMPQNRIIGIMYEAFLAVIKTAPTAAPGAPQGEILENPRGNKDKPERGV